MIRKSLLISGFLIAIIGFVFYFFSDYPGKNYHNEVRGGGRPWIQVRFYPEYQSNKNYYPSREITAEPCSKSDQSCIFQKCQQLANEVAILKEFSVEDGIWLCGINPRFFFGHISFEYILYSQNFPEGFEEGTSVSVRSWIQNIIGL